MANLSNINNKLLVGTNGEVRIGDTATVADVKLRIKQLDNQWPMQIVSDYAYGLSIDTSLGTDGNAGSLQIYPNSGGGFIVRNDSRVGIGTNSPERKLDVKSNSDTAPSAYLRGGKSSQGEIQQTGLIIGTQTTMAAGDYQGISFTGYTSASAIARGRAAVGVEAINGPGKMDLVFMTRYADDGTQLGAADEKMRITGGGNVLIGTTSIENPRGLARALEIEHGDTVGIILNDSRDTYPMGIENAGAVMNFTYNTSPLMTIIGSTGNVGIGTVTPSSFSGYTNLSLKAGSTGNNLDFFNSAGTRIGAIVTDGSDDVILEASGLSRNLIFKTDNAGTFSERMRIESTGVVKFPNTAASTGDVGTIAHYTNNYMYIRGGTSGLAIGDDGFGVSVYLNNSDSIQFNTGNGTEKMRIDSDGLVVLKSMSANTTRNLVFEGDSNSTSGNAGAIGMFADGARLTSNYYYSGGQAKYVAGNGQAAINLQTGTTAATTFMSFGVNPPADAAGVTERMRINSSGDISQPVALGAKIHAVVGNVAYPTYGFVGHTGRGMMMSNATTLNIVQAGFAQIKLMSTINTAYVSDGLWGTNATPNIIKSPAGLGMYFGYQDNGSGLYAAAYGFLTKSVDGLGNTNQREIIQIKDNDSGQINFTITNLGAVTARGTITANGSPSDIRLKENIKPINSALSKIKKIQGVSFDWKPSDSIVDTKEDYGFIAQEVQKSLPEIIKEDAIGMLSMRYNSVIPILVESVKELEKVVNDLKKEIIELKKN